MISKEQENKMIEKIKNQRLFIMQLQHYNMDTTAAMNNHEGYLQAIIDLLGLKEMERLESEAINLIKTEIPKEVK